MTVWAALVNDAKMSAPSLPANTMEPVPVGATMQSFSLPPNTVPVLPDWSRIVSLPEIAGDRGVAGSGEQAVVAGKPGDRAGTAVAGLVERVIPRSPRHIVGHQDPLRSWLGRNLAMLPRITRRRPTPASPARNDSFQHAAQQSGMLAPTAVRLRSASDEVAGVDRADRARDVEQQVGRVNEGVQPGILIDRQIGLVLRT